MVLIKNYIEISKPRDIVFSFLAEFENLPLWNYYLIKVKLISKTTDDYKKYYQVRKNDSQQFEVKEENYPEYVIIESTGEDTIKFKRRFTLVENEIGKCILVDDFEVDLGLPQIVQSAIKYKIKKSVRENLGKLKELLETGFTVLQDGKVSKLTYTN